MTPSTRFHGAYYLTVFKFLSIVSIYSLSTIVHLFVMMIDGYQAIDITTIVSVPLFSSEPRKPNVVQCGVTVVDYPAVQLNRCSTREVIDRGRCGDE